MLAFASAVLAEARSLTIWIQCSPHPHRPAVDVNAIVVVRHRRQRGWWQRQVMRQGMNRRKCRPIVRLTDRCVGLYGQASKRIWWMPWQLEAMKDVVACDKPRGASKQALIRGFPNGETHRFGGIHT
jgi:hypothetical protein